MKGDFEKPWVTQFLCYPFALHVEVGAHDFFELHVKTFSDFLGRFFSISISFIDIGRILGLLPFSGVILTFLFFMSMRAPVAIAFTPLEKATNMRRLPCKSMVVKPPSQKMRL